MTLAFALSICGFPLLSQDKHFLPPSIRDVEHFPCTIEGPQQIRVNAHGEIWEDDEFNVTCRAVYAEATGRPEWSALISVRRKRFSKAGPSDKELMKLKLQAEQDANEWQEQVRQAILAARKGETK